MMQHPKVSRNQRHPRFGDKVYKESTENMLNNSSEEGSSRGRIHHFPHTESCSVLTEDVFDAGASDSASQSSLPGMIKLRCSYGGRFFPRPSDGKVSYVGGENRIIKMKKKFSFQEFRIRMLAVYEQACLIKCQLPNEDLIDLVSVTCDEDLQNMMEEWTGAEEVESSHMPRVFLFSPSDLKDASASIGGPNFDSDYHYRYVSAINGLAEPGPRNIGQGLTSAPGTYLDEIISINAEGERVGSHPVASATPPVTDMLLPASDELFHATPAVSVVANAAMSCQDVQYGMLNRHDSTVQSYHEHAPHFVFHEIQTLLGMDPLETSHPVECRKTTTAAQMNKFDQGSYYAHFEKIPPIGPSQRLLRSQISEFPAASPDAGFKEAHFREKDVKVGGSSVAAWQDYTSTDVWDSENNVHCPNQQLNGIALNSSNKQNICLHTNNHFRGFPISIYREADKATTAASAHEGGTSSLSLKCFAKYLKAGDDPQPPHFVYAGQAYEAESDHIVDDHGASFGEVIPPQADSETTYRYFENTMLPKYIFPSGRVTHAQIDSLAGLSKLGDSVNSPPMMHAQLAMQQREPNMEPINGIVYEEILGALAPSSSMGLIVEDGTMQFHQHKNCSKAIAQKATLSHRHDMLDAFSLPQFVELPVRKEPMVGRHLHDHEESSIKSILETAYDQMKEGGDANSATVVCVQTSELGHLVTARSSKNDLMKMEQIHPDTVAHVSETFPSDSYNFSKEVMAEQLEDKISKAGSFEDHSPSEGKAQRHETKDQPPQLKEKRSQLYPSNGLEASETIQLKEQPLIKHEDQISCILENDSGAAYASQEDSTYNLCKILHGLRLNEKATVASYSPVFLMEEEIVELSSQMHQSCEVGNAEHSPQMHQPADVVNINTTSPECLSLLVFKDSKEVSGIDPLHNNEVDLSLTMQNREPQNWSIFQKLAQDEFVRKDASLLDQDAMSSPVYVENNEVNTRPFNFMPFQADTHNIKSHVKLIRQDSPTTMENESPTLLQEHHASPNASINMLDMDAECVNAEDVTPDWNMTGGEISPGPDSEYKDVEAVKMIDDEPRFDFSLDFNILDLQIIENADLEELRELGSGTFGTVYHGKWRGTDVAIKRIKKSYFYGRSSEQECLTNDFWTEAALLSKLHHPNVVAFYGVVKDGPEGTFATVSEFMSKGSLKKVLQRKDRPHDQRNKLRFAMETAFGMEYLHSKNIVHFDLKSDNVLVNMRVCKIGDLGLSKIKQNTMVSGGVRGTLPWMAPELLNGSSIRVSEKVDVFSFGIVMWEILTGEEPYAEMHYGAIIGGIVNDTLRPRVPDGCDPKWKALMEQCWSTNPAARPSFKEIVKRLRLMSEKQGTSGN